MQLADQELSGAELSLGQRFKGVLKDVAEAVIEGQHDAPLRGAGGAGLDIGLARRAGGEAGLLQFIQLPHKGILLEIKPPEPHAARARADLVVHQDRHPRIEQIQKRFQCMKMTRGATAHALLIPPAAGEPS